MSIPQINGCCQGLSVAAAAPDHAFAKKLCGPVLGGSATFLAMAFRWFVFGVPLYCLGIVRLTVGLDRLIN